MYIVSVIVPVYNAEKDLRPCLESLVAQTLKGTEIVIINDGSTDGSLLIAEEYAEKYEWVTVYSTKNMGVSHARNYGAAMSHGDFLAFVDADDYVEPDYCKAMYEKAVGDGNDLVVCRFDKITLSDGQMKHILPTNAFFEEDNFRMEDHRELLRKINVGPWDKLIKRELFDKIQFLEGIRYAEDQIFTVKVLCLAQRIGTVKKVLYHYCFESHSGVTSGFGTERLDWMTVMSKLYDFMCSDEAKGRYDTEIEYFIVSKSIRLFSAATIRTTSQRDLRKKLVIGIHDLLSEIAPNWRKNPYYISEVKQRSCRFSPPYYHYRNGKRYRPPYSNYGKGHLLFLINLSRLLPETLYKLVWQGDQVLFYICRAIWWRMHYSSRRGA